MLNGHCKITLSDLAFARTDWHRRCGSGGARFHLVFGSFGIFSAHMSRGPTATAPETVLGISFRLLSRASRAPARSLHLLQRLPFIERRRRVIRVAASTAPFRCCAAPGILSGLSSNSPSWRNAVGELGSSCNTFFKVREPLLHDRLPTPSSPSVEDSALQSVSFGLGNSEGTGTLVALPASALPK